MAIDINEIVEIDFDNPEYQPLLKDLQGNIIRGHGRDHSVHLFLKFKDNIAAVKKWISDFATEYVTSAEKQHLEAVEYKRYLALVHTDRAIQKPSNIFASFYLTVYGYLHLEVPYGDIPNDTYFRAGMKDPNTQTVLSDPAVEEWEVGFQEELHALVLLADDDIHKLNAAVLILEAAIADIAEIVHRDTGFILRKDPQNPTSPIIEHFGFRDGVSQPLFTKRDMDKARENSDFSHWNPIAPLSLVLFKDLLGTTQDSYGSFLVYRKLEQDVAGWNQEVVNLAKELDNVDPNLLGAYAVGRFQDGTPVVLADVEKNDPKLDDNFNYTGDTEGAKCPFHAHIRKTNPRGDTGSLTPAGVPLEEEKMHRIVRRGVSYGEPNIKRAAKNGSGLLFLCFQANLQNQFNFMQQAWANQNDFIKRGVGQDPVIGQGQHTGQSWPTQWGGPKKQELNFSLFVHFKGGEYFFAPSISSLKNIAKA